MGLALWNAYTTSLAFPSAIWADMASGVLEWTDHFALTDGIIAH